MVRIYTCLLTYLFGTYSASLLVLLRENLKLRPNRVMKNFPISMEP